TLAQREQWLLLNKIDLLPADRVEEHCRDIVERLGWKGPVHRLAAISKTGTEALCGKILDQLEARWEAEATDPDLAEAEEQAHLRMQQEARERIELLRERRRQERQGEDYDDDDDDDGDVEVIY